MSSRSSPARNLADTLGFYLVGMPMPRSETDHRVPVREDDAFEEFLAELFGLPPLTEAERGALYNERVDV